MSRTPLRKILRTPMIDGRVRVMVTTLDDAVLESWSEEPDGLTHYVDERKREQAGPANDG